MTDLTYLQLQAYVTYLNPENAPAHPHLIRQELMDRLAVAQSDLQITKALLGTQGSKLGLEPLALYLDAHGSELLGALRDIDGDPICAFRCTNFADWAPEFRGPLLELLLPYARTQPEALFEKLAAQALQLADSSWLEAIKSCMNRSEQDILQVLQTQPFPLEIQEGDCAYFCHLAEMIDFSKPEWLHYAEGAIRSGSLSTGAICLARGYRPRPFIDKVVSEKPNYPDWWVSRLLRRLETSRHAEITFYQGLPSVAELLPMSREDVALIIAGPTRQQIKQEARQKKRDENRQHFLSQGLPLPEGLKNPGE